LSLVQEYYRDILDREPEPGGAEGWADEICRIQNLGINVGEGFQAEARLFFNCQEYLNKNKTNTEFVTDLYQTFLQREPDAGGLAYWVGQLSCLTRGMLITQFAYCDEFKTYLTSLFGVDTTRPENNLVNDFYRGILGRLPDDAGYNSWLAQMREAQCTGPQAVEDVSYAQSLAFVQSTEYTAKGRDNVCYIEDLYNAILRRGADCAGFHAWVNNLDSMTRVQVLQAFTACIEFQTRVDAVIAAGCYSACEPQTCGNYTYDCSPGNPCVCYMLADGGGFCGPEWVCELPCPNGTVDCPNGYKCALNTCCGVPVCVPADCSAIAIAATEISMEGELTTFGVTQ